MWPAFINATLESLPKVEDKIAFDKFHVAKYLGEAVDVGYHVIIFQKGAILCSEPARY